MYSGYALFQWIFLHETPKWNINPTKQYMQSYELLFDIFQVFSLPPPQEVDEKGFSNEVNSAVKQYLDRADVMMLTQLVCLKTGKTVTVANIHVVYAPPGPDLQCLEVRLEFSQIWNNFNFGADF